MPDLIRIKELRVPTHIGVPDEERQLAQSLTLNLDIAPKGALIGLNDDLNGTIDYATVTRRILEVAAERPRRLLETLGDDLAKALMDEFPIHSLRIEIEKQILPGMRAVSLDRHFNCGDL